MTAAIAGVVALAVGVVVGFLIRANMAKSSANTLEAQSPPEGRSRQTRSSSRPTKRRPRSS